MTATILCEAKPIEERIDRLATLVERLADTLDATGGAEQPEWLPRRKLAARFGMSPRSADVYIASAISSGKLSHFQPADMLGKRGHTLYRVADFEAYLRRLENT